jgi:Delta24-sterol reductase
MPKVVAEFREITVGGAIAGAALESSSHLHGQFVDTVAWIKAWRGDGTTVTTVRGESFWCGLSGTYGSMGVILEAAVECVPATPLVLVSYFSFRDVDDAVAAIVKTAGEERHAFLDGVVFPEEQVPTGPTVIMRGEMVGSFEMRPSTKVGWTSRLRGGSFYYEHVRTLVTRHVVHMSAGRLGCNGHDDARPFHSELIPTEDYLFRYDHGAFWMARPMIFSWRKLWSYFPFTIGLFVASYRWVRLLTGSMFTTKNMFRLLKCAPESVVASKMVVQDLYSPPGAAPALLSWIRSSIPISTPLWLCPVRTNKTQPFTPSFHQTETILLNCGIYGRVADGCGVKYTIQAETKCQEFGGRKMLYAQNHYAEGTFWTIYNKGEYDRLRKEHAADDAFPSMFEKTCGIPQRTNTWWEAFVSLLL